MVSVGFKLLLLPLWLDRDLPRATPHGDALVVLGGSLPVAGEWYP